MFAAFGWHVLGVCDRKGEESTEAIMAHSMCAWQFWAFTYRFCFGKTSVAGDAFGVDISKTLLLLKVRKLTVAETPAASMIWKGTRKRVRYQVGSEP